MTLYRSEAVEASAPGDALSLCAEKGNGTQTPSCAGH
jgi:hypothetical protein